MDYLYIDEKGPQEKIRITNPYNQSKKIKLGNDNMYVYVADIVKINEKNISEIINKYQLLEKNYMSSRNFNPKKELKGKDILKKNFQYGVASLKDREVNFYNSLFDLLLKNRVDNLLFSINKMSLVADHRLLEWIFKLEEARVIVSAKLFKYSLVKYLENEAGDNVIQSIFDPQKKNKDILIEIQKDMETFISKHNNIQRMKLQIQNYGDIINIIRETQHLIQEKPFNEVLFNWDKVSFNVDLWLLEMKDANKIDMQSLELILDEGIPLKPFKQLNIPSIKESEDSATHVGLRISDVLVVISGKLISNLAQDVKYNKNNPQKRTLLPIEWFQLNEQQFYLLKKMKEYFFPNNSRYCFIVDTYFDDALLFESYCRYISTYENFHDYKKYFKVHVDEHYNYLETMIRNKYDLAVKTALITKEHYGSTRSAIKAGLLRPI
ncbi:DUF3800 domain-containing protein [Bacillus altitudinis]|uniref:DUF3800 domain-containing protein n=1 Tax=Bacillus altitudinis TaxID=293387 RepID=UPI000DBBDD88|nr:DUF3800 domain-containing protein [Bacillus altitudinis]SPR95089.1 conserved hypothetical protein [Bacillus altitudinis]